VLLRLTLVILGHLGYISKVVGGLQEQSEGITSRATIFQAMLSQAKVWEKSEPVFKVENI
jgi:hypothetical protein